MAFNRLRNCIDQEIIRFSIETLLGSSLSKEPLSFDRELRFDRQKQVAWRAGDYEAYRIIYPTKRYAGHRLLTTTTFLLTGKKLGLFIQPKNEMHGFVIYLRDSVVVTVAKSLGVAIKVLRKTANQKDIIKNERQAYMLLPEFVPAIVKYQNAAQLEPFDYVVSRFVENSHPVTSEEWSTVFPAVMQALLLCYERAGFKRISVDEVVVQVAGILEKHQGHSEFFELCRKVIQNINRVCLRFRDAKLFTTFVHGDVTWDAIHRNGDSIKIIDWGNAGYKSVFYDLFVQEFYRADSKFWGNFFEAKSHDFFSSYFFGAFDTFYRGLTTRMSTSFSLYDIKANLCVSLLQNAIDNFLRYRVVDELEGVEFFRLIEKVGEFLCAAS